MSYISLHITKPIFVIIKLIIAKGYSMSNNIIPPHKSTYYLILYHVRGRNNSIKRRRRKKGERDQFNKVKDLLPHHNILIYPKHTGGAY